jgi:hypothetical protein
MMSSTAMQRLLVLLGIGASLAGIVLLQRVSGATAGALALALGSVPSSPAGRGVVVAELFTSEGCSSCPPADAVLARLSAEPLGATTVLALGEHVDYWDHLGWRDPYSSPLFSARQSLYDARVFHSGIFTPQLVVDGRYPTIGSDIRAVERAIAAASRFPKARITVVATLDRPDEARIGLTVTVPSDLHFEGDADLIVALTEDRLHDAVERGENRGRTLEHSAVVRTFATAGTIGRGQPGLDTTRTVRVDPAWRVPDVRVVALLQERASRHIVGAGSGLLQTPGGSSM